MDRRDFLKAASAAGLAVVSPHAFGNPEEYYEGSTRGTYAPYEGPLYLFFNAGGGWDVTSYMDPKGADNQGQIDNQDRNAMNLSYLTANIENAGNIRYAPIGNRAAFFQQHFNRLTVINGLDMETNGHDSGNRHWLSGRLSEGHPSMPAFIAAAMANDAPMAYLAFGGFAETQGIVARTRAGNINALNRLAYPARINPDDEFSGYHSVRATEIIQESLWKRDQFLLASEKLPRVNASVNTLFTARSGSNELRRLQEFLPDQLSQNNLEQQAQLAIAAYKAGICVSGQLSRGGFDTHGGNDAAQITNGDDFLNGVSFAYNEAVRQGVADRVVIVVGSDFGRTPRYNDGMGKDHWSIGSNMVLTDMWPGNRVVGETNFEHRAFDIDYATLQPVGTIDGETKLHPGHVMRALRVKAGLIDHDLSSMFPLAIDDLPIFA